MGYSSQSENDAVPLTPVGLLFSQPELYQVMNTAVTTAGPIDVSALKAQLVDSAFTRLPRFTSLFIRHPKSGRGYWRQTHAAIDHHVKVIDDHRMDDINDYLADLSVSCPLPTDKPLWEVHVLMHQNCIVFRIHHALADGISTMSLLQSFCSGKPQLTADRKRPFAVVASSGKRSTWELMKTIWLTFIFTLEFLFKCMWMKDKKTVVAGGDGLEHWPRKLATASFLLEDMKIVKKSVHPNATINDVMLGVLSLGMSDYIHRRSHNAAISGGQRITTIVMVNLRPPFAGIPDIEDLMKTDARIGWGNKISFLLHPLQIHKLNHQTNPLHRLKAAKASMDKKKASEVALVSYILGKLASKFISHNFTTRMLYRLACNTCLLFSNTMGPSQEIYIAGNRVTSLKASASGSAQAITIHVVSYAGKAEMQILVAKDVIPDPGVLAQCLEDALHSMKKAVLPYHQL